MNLTTFIQYLINSYKVQLGQKISINKQPSSLPNKSALISHKMMFHLFINQEPKIHVYKVTII